MTTTDQTLTRLVIEWAARTPDALAVRAEDGALSYRQLDRMADDYAAALLIRGVRPGDRVLLWSHKSTRLVALMQGCLRRGAVYVPVSPANPPGRLTRIHDSARPTLVVADDGCAGRVEPGGWPNCPVATLDTLHAEGEGAAAPPRHQAAPDDLAYILYTSGSTGEPK
ncbi:MAG: AMP-binding protein, partial [Nocardiopsaceae bacterium]|nr:AMP-binding protein [Nocardiopsaceae bacterium]